LLVLVPFLRITYEVFWCSIGKLVKDNTRSIYTMAYNFLRLIRRRFAGMKIIDLSRDLHFCLKSRSSASITLQSDVTLCSNSNPCRARCLDPTATEEPCLSVGASGQCPSYLVLLLRCPFSNYSPIIKGVPYSHLSAIGRIFGIFGLPTYQNSLTPSCLNSSRRSTCDRSS
jgi:hypothetical protein